MAEVASVQPSSQQVESHQAVQANPQYKKVYGNESNDVEEAVNRLGEAALPGCIGGSVPR